MMVIGYQRYYVRLLSGAILVCALPLKISRDIVLFFEERFLNDYLQNQGYHLHNNLN